MFLNRQYFQISCLKFLCLSAANVCYMSYPSHILYLIIQILRVQTMVNITNYEAPRYGVLEF